MAFLDPPDVVRRRMVCRNPGCRNHERVVLEPAFFVDDYPAREKPASGIVLTGKKEKSRGDEERETGAFAIL
jgi:hypothetical protein